MAKSLSQSAHIRGIVNLSPPFVREHTRSIFEPPRASMRTCTHTHTHTHTHTQDIEEDYTTLKVEVWEDDELKDDELMGKVPILPSSRLRERARARQRERTEGTLDCHPLSRLISPLLDSGSYRYERMTI